MEKFGGSLNNFSKSEKQSILEMKISEIKKLLEILVLAIQDGQHTEFQIILMLIPIQIIKRNLQSYIMG